MKLSSTIDQARPVLPLRRSLNWLRSRTRCAPVQAHFGLAEVLELAGDRAGATAEENAARELLHLKGAKGALVGAPSA
jgi:hypothetical protein